ncbi:hypothetical protein [Nocardioides okcheonensis]|uniref:hypothetical protein n=1 Tax=Nocardioides okcheonensis TaxID=2894081 RepID=UPI001E34B736|nr:hypothetical protein [Nocardioides okcheonensis]UFN44856.1 hypothetical protein LN652_01140 [Nocardioides okcheonensis]
MSSTGTSGSALGGFIAMFLPILIGCILAAIGLFSLVYSQTTAPDKNPASQQILVYGD